jgi:hypothetical protein
MKILLPALLLALLMLAPLAPQAGAPKKPEVGKPAPSLRLNDHHGNIVELGGKRANWTVLAFFPKAATPG